MVRFFFVVCAVCLAHMLGARTISGIVMSENDSTAIAGAICNLKSGDKVLASVATDADGVFTLQTPGDGAVSLAVAMTGFMPVDVMVESGKKKLDLGIIYMSGSIVLDEVTATARQFTDTRGRTIVYPSQTELKASPTAISLFQKLALPGLEADPINRSLSVDRGTPMILIDGVPSTIDDVRTLKPDDIARVEYSRITPARYLDQGKTGLVNITMKKRTDGGSFFAWGRTALQTAFVDGNVRVSYHQGKSQFSLAYGPSWRNYQQVYDDGWQSYVGDDFRVDLREKDRAPFDYLNNELRGRYDLRLSDATLLSVTLNTTLFSSHRRSLGHTDDSAVGIYDWTNKNQSHQVTPSLDVFLRHDFDEKNSLEAEVVGTLGSDDYRRTNTYHYADDTEVPYTVDADNRRRSLISELSYIHSFSDKTSLGLGVQNTVSHTRNTYLSSDYEPVLTENNNYIYARFSQTVGKLYLNLSTGAKLFWVKNDMNRRNFVRNLSMAQLVWNINDQWNIQGSFQYSPDIPSLSALTDYMQQSTPYLFTNGNPDLKVADRFMYQFMPSYKYGKFSTSLLVNYFHSSNPFMSEVEYLGDQAFLSHTVNGRRSRRLGANLNLKISDLYGFGASLNVGFDHYDNATYAWRHTLSSWSGSISAWWSKDKFTVSAWYKLPGKYLNGSRVNKDENGNALQVYYAPDKHWNIGLGWMYIFTPRGTQYPSWNYSPVNPGYSDRYIKNNANMVVVSVRYQADFGSIFRTGRRSLNNSDSGSSLLKM